MPRVLTAPPACLALVILVLATPFPMAGPAVAQTDSARWLDRLRTGTESQREEAAFELAESAPPEALPLLIRALRQDESSAVRQAAAFALGAYHPPSEGTVSALMEALAGRDARLKTAVATTLSRLGKESEPVVRALIAALGAEDPRIRQSALIVVERIGPPVVGQAPGVVTAVAERLEGDPDERVRRFAVAALAGIAVGAREARPALLRAVRSDASERVREYSAGALRTVGVAADAAVPVLVQALADPDWGVRAAAARALGEYGSAASAAKPALKKAANEDPEAPVREAAKAALDAISRPSSQPSPPA